MPKREMIFVGASSGGLEALRIVVGGLPADLAASVFIVWHLSPQSPNLLPRLLAVETSLQVISAENGACLKPGAIYVAPPDQHLLVIDGYWASWRRRRRRRRSPAWARTWRLKTTSPPTPLNRRRGCLLAAI